MSPEIRVHGAAQSHQTGPHVLRLKPRTEKLVVYRCGSKIPEDGLAAAREKRPTRKFVAFPLADLGRGDVAVVHSCLPIRLPVVANLSPSGDRTVVLPEQPRKSNDDMFNIHRTDGPRRAGAACAPGL